jgi:flagellar basal-body rod protein FlgF
VQEATVNSGYYAACAGLLARSDNLELAANNLANVNTTGYKAQREIFQTVLAATQSGQSALSKSINSFGVIGGTATNLQSGQMQFTGNDLDVAVEGPGFFSIQTKNGVRYTRNGNFDLSKTGQLQTTKGDAVLNEQGKPISVPGGKVAISSDGTLSVNGATVGQLKLVEFANGTNLAPEGDSYYAAPAGTAKASPTSQVRQGALEGANMDPVSGTVSLIVLQRNAEMLQKALTIFHTEFNKIAAEDLPRAGS